MIQEATSSFSDYTTLRGIADDIDTCARCPLHETRTRTVPGTGHVRAALMFIGEGPGKHEDQQGVPFVGRAGDVLNQLIHSMGIARDEVFITNIVKCRPPNNRNPSSQEIEACLPYLQAQIQIVRPKILCTLGLPATQTLLQTKESLTRLRGSWFAYGSAQLMPTFHPAYLLRNPLKKQDALEDFQELLRVYRSIHYGE